MPRRPTATTGRRCTGRPTAPPTRAAQREQDKREGRDERRMAQSVFSSMEVLGFGELSAYEKGWFDKMMPELKAQIQKGVDFANQ